LRLRFYGYNDHDNLDHGSIITDYLDIDIKNNVYNNSRAPVHSVLVVTCVHATPAMTMGGKREDAPKGDAVTTLGAKPVQTQWMMTWSRS
jgi:hypothetical protein